MDIISSGYVVDVAQRNVFLAKKCSLRVIFLTMNAPTVQRRNMVPLPLEKTGVDSSMYELLVMAYKNWVNCEYSFHNEEREIHWRIYCKVRDGNPLTVSEKFHLGIS